MGLLTLVCVSCPSKLLPPQPRHGESDSKKAGAGKILVAAAAEFQLRPGSRFSFNWDQVPGCPSLLGLGAGFRSVVTHLLCRAGCRIVVWELLTCLLTARMKFRRGAESSWNAHTTMRSRLQSLLLTTWNLGGSYSHWSDVWPSMHLAAIRESWGAALSGLEGPLLWCGGAWRSSLETTRTIGRSSTNQWPSNLPVDETKNGWQWRWQILLAGKNWRGHRHLDQEVLLLLKLSDERCGWGSFDVSSGYLQNGWDHLEASRAYHRTSVTFLSSQMHSDNSQSHHKRKLRPFNMFNLHSIPNTSWTILIT